MGSPQFVRVVVEPAEFAQEYPRRAQSGFSPQALTLNWTKRDGFQFPRLEGESAGYA
jgi:hypothetical protein